jgi:hypothetical protein
MHMSLGQLEERLAERNYRRLNMEFVVVEVA